MLLGGPHRFFSDGRIKGSKKLREQRMREPWQGIRKQLQKPTCDFLDADLGQVSETPWGHVSRDVKPGQWYSARGCGVQLQCRWAGGDPSEARNGSLAAGG